MNPLGIPFGLTGAFGPKKMARMGLFGAPAAVMAHGGNQGQAQGDDNPAPEKAYMDTWQGKLAGIGDILLRASGNGGNPMLHYKLQEQAQKQAMAQRQQMAEQQRQWGREDKQWEWENAPRNAGKPHYWETNNGSLAMIDPITGKPSVVYEDPTPKINWMTIDNGDGTKQIVPVGPNGPMMGGTPPMGQLPTFSQDDWDKAGGTGSNVGGGFRR